MVDWYRCHFKHTRKFNTVSGVRFSALDFVVVIGQQLITDCTHQRFQYLSPNTDTEREREFYTTKFLQKQKHICAGECLNHLHL